MRVALFVPCFIDQIYPDVGRATVRLLERCGCEVQFDAAQTCCGQPAYNSGYVSDATIVARHFVETFRKHEVIVAPSGSCVAFVRHHLPRLVEGSDGVAGRVFELAEFLVGQLGVRDVGATCNARAALHLPCHLLRELRGAGPIRTLLSHVRGLEIVELPSDAWCCGFGGKFAIQYPELSSAMAGQKIAQIVASGVDLLISPESCCLAQLTGVAQQQGRPIRALHYAELLAPIE